MIDPQLRLAAIMAPGLRTEERLAQLNAVLAQAWDAGQEAYDHDILSGEDTPNPFRRTA